MDNSTPSTRTPHYPKTFSVAWSSLAPSSVRIKFDGSVRNNSRSTVVIRDNLGNKIISRTYNIGKSFSILAEVMALCNNHLRAMEHNIRHTFIEDHNLLIINLLWDNEIVPGRFVC